MCDLDSVICVNVKYFRDIWHFVVVKRYFLN